MVKSRLLIVLVVMVVGFCVIVGKINSMREANPALREQPYYLKVAPSVELAPKALPTQSRLYYVRDYEETDEVIVLRHYYTFDEDTWRESKSPLPLPKSLYGDIKLYDRGVR